MSSSDLTDHLCNSSPLSRLQNTNKIPLQQLHNSIDLKMSVLRDKPQNYITPKSKLNRSKLKTSNTGGIGQGTGSQQFSEMKASSFIFNLPELSPPEITFEITDQLRHKINQLKEDIVTKLPAIKSSQFSSSKIQSLFSRRVVLKDLQIWLQEKLKSPPLTHEDSIEYKNMIMGVGMKEAIRLIGTRCAEEANVVNEIWELTWSICREIILHLSKRAHKCEKILTEQASFFRVGCENRIKQCQVLVKQLRQTNAELKHRSDKLASDLACIKKKNKQLKLIKLNLQDNYQDLKEQFEIIFKQNLVLHMKLSPNDQARRQWAKKKYKTYLNSKKTNDLLFKKFLEDFLQQNHIEFDDDELAQKQLIIDINKYKEQKGKRNFEIEKQLHESFRTAQRDTQTIVLQFHQQSIQTDRKQTEAIAVQTKTIFLEENGVVTDQIPELKPKSKKQKQKAGKKGNDKKKGQTKTKLKGKTAVIQQTIQDNQQNSQQQVKQLEVNKISKKKTSRFSTPNAMTLKQDLKQKQQLMIEQKNRQSLVVEASKTFYIKEQIKIVKQEYSTVNDRQEQQTMMDRNSIIQQPIAKIVNPRIETLEEKQEKQYVVEISEQISNQYPRPLSIQIGINTSTQKIPEQVNNSHSNFHHTQVTSFHNQTGQQQHQQQKQRHEQKQYDEDAKLYELLQDKKYIDLYEALRNKLRQEKKLSDSSLNLKPVINQAKPERGEIINENPSPERKPFSLQYRKKSIGQSNKVSEHASMNFSFEQDTIEQHISNLNQPHQRNQFHKVSSSGVINPKISRRPSHTKTLKSYLIRPKQQSIYNLQHLNFVQLCNKYINNNFLNQENESKQIGNNSEYSKRMLREQYREIHRQVVNGHHGEKTEKQMRAVLEKSLTPILKELCREIQNAQKQGLQKLQQTKISYIPLHILITNKFNLNFGVKKVASKHIKDVLSCLKGIKKYTQKYTILAYFMLQSHSLKSANPILEHQDSQLLFFYILLITVMEGLTADNVLGRDECQLIGQLAGKYLARDQGFIAYVRNLYADQEGGNNFIGVYKKIIARYQGLSNERIQEMSPIFQTLSVYNTNKESTKSPGIRCTDLIKFISAFTIPHQPNWQSVILNTLIHTLLSQKQKINEPKIISYEYFVKFVIKCPEFCMSVMRDEIGGLGLLGDEDLKLSNLALQNKITQLCHGNQFLEGIGEYLFKTDNIQKEQVKFWVAYLHRFNLEQNVQKIMGSLLTGVLDPRSQALILATGIQQN